MKIKHRFCLPFHPNSKITPRCQVASLSINGTNIPFSPLVRSLGLTLDPTLIFRQNISNICETAYFGLGRISSVRHYLSVDATKTLLVCSFVLSRLDHCNSLLAGSPKYHLRKRKKNPKQRGSGNLQVIKPDHISPLLHAPHWFPVHQRIKCKHSSICLSSVTGTGPQYLADILKIYFPSR